MTQWVQNYDPFHNAWISTAAAATPVVLLFYLLAVRKILAYKAAVYAFLAALVLAGFVFGMPWPMVAGAAANGLVYGFIRIAWTLLCAVWVYDLTVETGHFETIKESIGGVTADRRLQVLLIAFAFGAVLEGAGGGGAPVAIAGAMMVGLGFKPMAGRGIVPDRQHVAGGLWRGGQSHPGAGGRDGTAGVRPERHGGPHPAVDRGDPAVLAGAHA